MAANTGERTLISALIPPGAAHVDGLYVMSVSENKLNQLVDVGAQMAALTSDLLVRVAPKSTIRSGIAERLVLLPQNSPLLKPLRLRYLRLTCVTNAYQKIWEECYDPQFEVDRWAQVDDSTMVRLNYIGKTWDERVPLRRAEERRQALVESDVLVALGLGISVEELTTVFLTQFPVLAGYENSSKFYDGNGRLLPKSVASRIPISPTDQREEDLKSIHPDSGVPYEYVPPFHSLNRVTDYAQCYSEFAERFSNFEINSE